MKGNECKRLLKNLSYLDENLPQHLDEYRVALEKFNDLETSCFGSDLDPFYEDRIADFRDAYLALGCPMTTKVWMMFQCGYAYWLLGNYQIGWKFFQIYSLPHVIVCLASCLTKTTLISQAHLVFDHLADYLEFEGTGMGLFSEQTGESLHSDFKKHWLHYQVKNSDAPSYADRLYRATVAYNSSHIWVYSIHSFKMFSVIDANIAYSVVEAASSIAAAASSITAAASCVSLLLHLVLLRHYSWLFSWYFFDFEIVCIFE